jgi:hypothetical protein
MREAGARIAVVVLAATFAWAGVAKTLHAERWRQDIRAYRLARPVRAFAFLVLPWIEIGLALVAVGGRADIAAWVALALVASFSIAIARARLLQGTNKLSCGCFGGTAARDYRLLLLRNLALGSVAAWILLDLDASWSWALIPGSRDVLPALLVILVIAAILWTVRQAAMFVRGLPTHRPDPITGRSASDQGDMTGTDAGAARRTEPPPR